MATPIKRLFTSDPKDDVKQKISPLDSSTTFSDSQTILGITKDGKPITLEHFATKGTRSIFIGTGYNSESYPIRRFFQNAHFSDAKKIAFKSARIELSHLYEWVAESMVEITREYNEEGTSYKSISFNCRPGKKNNLAKINDFQLSLRTYPETPFFPSKNISITQKTELIIESTTSDEILYNDLTSIIYKFKDFLTVATGLSIEIQSIKASSQANTEKLPDGKTYNPEIIIYDYFINSEAPAKSIRSEQMNFSFPEISNNSEVVLLNWFKKSESLKDVFNLYFNTLNTQNLNIRNKFLSIISAVEGFVRLTNPALKSERDLAKIIEFLQASQKAHGFLFGSDQFELIKNTRDKYLHVQLTNPSRKILDETRLRGVISRLSALLELCILSDLGFEGGSLKLIAERKFKNAKRY